MGFRPATNAYTQTHIHTTHTHTHTHTHIHTHVLNRVSSVHNSTFLSTQYLYSKMCHLCPYITTGLQPAQWLHCHTRCVRGAQCCMHKGQVLSVLSRLPLPQAPPQTHWMTSGRWCGNTMHPSLSC